MKYFTQDILSPYKFNNIGANIQLIIDYTSHLELKYTELAHFSLNKPYIKQKLSNSCTNVIFFLWLSSIVSIAYLSNL